MSTIEVWWIGIALAMDCFAISIACGISARKIVFGVMSVMILAFGLFQGGMLLAGYGCTSLLSGYLTMAGKWIAVALLTFLGGKMIWDDICPRRKENASCLSYRQIPVLATATSIDALSVGVSFSCMQNMDWNQTLAASGVVAFCSFLLSAVGMGLGIFIGEKVNFPTSFIGGIILISIAIKMIIEYFTGL